MIIIIDWSFGQFFLFLGWHISLLKLLFWNIILVLKNFGDCFLWSNTSSGSLVCCLFKTFFQVNGRFVWIHSSFQCDVKLLWISICIKFFECFHLFWNILWIFRLFTIWGCFTDCVSISIWYGCFFLFNIGLSWKSHCSSTVHFLFLIFFLNLAVSYLT